MTDDWRAIETAPINTPILCFCPLPGSEYEVVAIHERGERWLSAYEGEDIFDPTHWTPLPAFPREHRSATEASSEDDAR